MASDTLYETITDALVGDGYIVIENALEGNIAQKLLNFAKEESAYKSAGISNSSSLHVDTTKRSDKTLWLNEDSAAQSEFLAFVEGLRVYLNRSLYLGLDYYESHFAIYEDGDFYEKHLDAFKNSKNRVVTTVYYLNEDYSCEDGGELIIYNSDNQEIKRVQPNSNTLVVFMSEKFPHEVLPAKKRRYSIAGWLRVK